MKLDTVGHERAFALLVFGWLAGAVSLIYATARLILWLTA